MNKKLNLYDIVRNSRLGPCHLLKKKNVGSVEEVYLFYSETNTQHFIVCEGVNEDNHFLYARYFKELEDAIREYKAI